MDENEVTGFVEDNRPERPSISGDPLDAVKAVALPKEAEVEDVACTPGVLTPDGASGPDAGKVPGTDEYGEFTWPDGYMADREAMEKFIPIAQKLGLKKEGAQSLATLYAELDQERHREQNRFIAENNAKWVREIQAHPEFGGRNLEQTGTNVASMMRRYGTPLLMAQIRQMNVQNWPEMFFFLARVSQAVSEDCSPSSLPSAEPNRSTAQLLFPGLK